MDEYKVIYLLNGARVEEIITAMSSYAAAEVVKAKYLGAKLQILQVITLKFHN